MNPTAVLQEMLTYCRPAGSTAEADFLARYVLPLPGAYVCFGQNIVVTVGASPILWSCHTDTVHRTSGRQTIAVRKGVATLSKASLASGRNCLGADDTAGVWLCREMVLAGVPGTYVFHYGEERGGIGSSALADHADGAVWLAQFTHAIAFDRRGTADVITHQAYGRTASDLGAQSIADILGTAGLTGYRPSDEGIFTDTANYAGLIGECTNVSVGYRHEHTVREYLDLAHVLALRDALLAGDWTAIAGDREPGADDDDEWEDDGSWRYLPTPTVYQREDTNWLRDLPTNASYRLDPEYDEVQAQLLVDLLKYRRPQ